VENGHKVKCWWFHVISNWRALLWNWHHFECHYGPWDIVSWNFSLLKLCHFVLYVWRDSSWDWRQEQLWQRDRIESIHHKEDWINTGQDFNSSFLRCLTFGELLISIFWKLTKFMKMYLVKYDESDLQISIDQDIKW